MLLPFGVWSIETSWHVQNWSNFALPFNDNQAERRLMIMPGMPCVAAGCFNSNASGVRIFNFPKNEEA